MAIPLSKVMELLALPGVVSTEVRQRNIHTRRENGKTAQLPVADEYKVKAIRAVRSQLKIPIEDARRIIPEL